METRSLGVDDGRIAYDDTGGAGQLILAIPGIGARVITMDVRGFGQTLARWNDYSAHAVARDALALLDHLNSAPAIILGNSFAAGSALWSAHDAQARVSGVVIWVKTSSDFTRVLC